MRIQCGEGFYPPATSPSKRRLTLGTGMPTDPRFSINSDGAASDGNRVFTNQQGGSVTNLEAPEIPSNGAGVLYWRERP
jgi:hypothetical protein